MKKLLMILAIFTMTMGVYSCESEADDITLEEEKSTCCPQDGYEDDDNPIREV